MSNNRLVLLKNLLLETSQFNRIRNERDSKKRGKAVVTLVGEAILGIVLIIYMTLLSQGYVAAGITASIPSLCAIVITLATLLLTFLKVNGYLFAFSDYDITMSLPIKIRDVVSAKFLYMYLHSLPLCLCVSIPMMIIYGIAVDADVLLYVLWTVLSFIIPVLAMIVAAILGALIMAVSSGFRNKSLIQTILTFAFVIAIIVGEFALTSTSSSEDISALMMQINRLVEKIRSFWPPVQWFSDAVVEHKISSILLLVGITILTFELFFLIVSTGFRQINSKLMSHAARRNYKIGELKSQNVTVALIKKEFRRLFKSSLYITNNLLGEVFVFIISIAVLFVDMDKFLEQTFTAAVPKTSITILIPVLVHFFLGLTTTTAVSFSLEGKNYWILKSLPIKSETIIRAKILFQLVLAVPFMIIATSSLSFALHAPFPHFLFFLAIGLVFCCFSAVYGMFCNLLLPKLEWENEIEVVKQGASLMIYLFSNMILTMVLFIAVFVAPINSFLLLGIIAGVLAALSVIFYAITMKMAKKL